MKHLNTYKLFETSAIKEYPFKKIEEILRWFDSKYIHEVNKEGWLISMTHITNSPLWGSRYIFQIQKIDEPEKDQAKIESDEEAVKLANRWGFVCDDWNIVYDFNMDIFNNRKKLKSAFDLNLL